MIRKINEKARRALKKSLILGGALLFIAAITGCDELSAADAPGLSNGIRPSNYYPALLKQQATMRAIDYYPRRR